ncbi:hypothetical protein GGR09_001705 [Bartonella heixiaziensis]
MTQNNKNVLENNSPLNDNDNVSLKEHACLKAIPYMNQALQQNGWGTIQPISAALLSVEPFHVAQVPLTLSRYIYDVADIQQSSLDFIAVSALCGLTAVIGNRVRIAPKQHAN